MIHKAPAIALLAVLLLVLSPLAAGCLSVPGPEDAKKNAVVTTIKTTPAPERTTVVLTPVVKQTPVSAATTVPATTPAGVAAAASAAGTCVQQGGTVAEAGFQCPGTWLAASDTFSCCSALPVRTTAATGNESVTAVPPAFSLSVNLDDSLGSITP